MKKLVTLVVVSLCFVLAVQAKTTTKKTTVLFNTAKHQLTKESIKKIKVFLHQNRTDLDYEISIEGHTDSRGNLDYNKKLSSNRTKSVRQFLIQNGVDPKRISFSYKGELDPKRPNVNADNMQANRRVEITFKTYHFDNIKELEEALSPDKTSVHIIKPNEEIVVEGRKGVKVLIKPNTFTYTDGRPVNENIRFELTESLSYKDYVSSGLITKCNDVMLESGGMIKMKAKTISGKPVVVNPNKQMGVVIPTENRQDNMEVFTSHAGDDWDAKNQPITNTLYPIAKTTYPKMRAVSRLPSYIVDVGDDPKSGIKARVARKPQLPRKADYFKRIPWYKLNRFKIRKRQRNDYNQAVYSYDQRMQDYKGYVKKYNSRMEDALNGSKNYDLAMEQWNKNNAKVLGEFSKSRTYLRTLKRYNAIYLKNYKDFKKRARQWELDRDNTLASIEGDMNKLGVTDANSMNNYVFACNQLSWINVDRFYHLKPEEKQIITLRSDEKIGDERVLIMFKNIGSMIKMHANADENKYTQAGFPKEEPAAIFAYKVENGKPMIYYREINKIPNYQLRFKETTFAEMKAILGRFNGHGSV